MTVFIKLTRADIHRTLPYALICETRNSSRWNTGTRSRLWAQEFTKEERNAAKRIFQLADTWTLRTGLPNSVSMKLSTLELWHKLGDFRARI